jgi:hypothetical protein
MVSTHPAQLPSKLPWCLIQSDLHELVDKIPGTEIDQIAMLVHAVCENNRLLIAALLIKYSSLPFNDLTTFRAIRRTPRARLPAPRPSEQTEEHNTCKTPPTYVLSRSL